VRALRHADMQGTEFLEHSQTARNARVG